MEFTPVISNLQPFITRMYSTKKTMQRKTVRWSWVPCPLCEGKSRETICPTCDGKKICPSSPPEQRRLRYE